MRMPEALDERGQNGENRPPRSKPSMSIKNPLSSKWHPGSAIATLALMLVPALAGAQPDTEQARRVFSETNQQIPQLERVTFFTRRPGAGYSAEGTAWRDKNTVKKIEIIERDDSGDVVSEWYFSGSTLVFVLESVRGFSNTAPGNKLRTVTEERFYFRDGKLFKWLSGMGNNKTENPTTGQAFTQAAQSLLAASAAFVNAVQQTGASGPVRVGGVNKQTIGTVTGLNAGDRGCYIKLTSEQGRAFEEMADFSVCEKPKALVGKRVSLGYSVERVMAAACQGDPDCTKTDPVVLVTTLTVLPSAGVVAPVASAGAANSVTVGAQTKGSWCTTSETVVFSCKTGGKTVSVCSSAGASTRKGTLQYRFGKVGPAEPPEVAVPAGETLPQQAATGTSVPFAGGGGIWLRFRKGDYAYVVYSGTGRWGPKGEVQDKQGVVVERSGKSIAHLRCATEPEGQLSPDWLDSLGIRTRDNEDFLFPD